MTEFCPMQILVLAATEMEIAPFIAQNSFTQHLITGVGAPACMYHLQKKLSEQPYDCIIQAGIAGSFTNDLALGETVLVQKDVFADLGIFENGALRSLFDAGFADQNERPYKNGWLENENMLQDRFSIHKVAGITVNMVTENKAMIQEYKRLYDPIVETMEGAALHYVCLSENIPFLQLRSISNAVGERDKSKWTIAAAVQNLNNHLIQMVQVLTQQQ
jgi:futalosine hydrolase